MSSLFFLVFFPSWKIGKKKHLLLLLFFFFFFSSSISSSSKILDLPKIQKPLFCFCFCRVSRMNEWTHDGWNSSNPNSSNSYSSSKDFGFSFDEQVIPSHPISSYAILAYPIHDYVGWEYDNMGTYFYTYSYDFLKRVGGGLDSRAFGKWVRIWAGT